MASPIAILLIVALDAPIKTLLAPFICCLAFFVIGFLIWMCYCRGFITYTFDFDASSDSITFIRNPACIARLFCTYYKKDRFPLSDVNRFEIVRQGKYDSGFKIGLTDNVVYDSGTTLPREDLNEIGMFISRFRKRKPGFELLQNTRSILFEEGPSQPIEQSSSFSTQTQIYPQSYPPPVYAQTQPLAQDFHAQIYALPNDTTYPLSLE